MPPAPPPRTAVILAAGLGSRLSGVHRGPKGLLEIGGASLVPRSLQQLAGGAGVSRFIVVIGWRGEDYRIALRSWGSAVTFVENPAYASTGSLRSLTLAAAVAAEDIWLLESDLLYDSDALTTLSEVDTPDAVLASGPTESGDEVWIFADAGGRLELLTKTPALGRAPTGELVGISRLSRPLLDALAAAAPSLSPQAHYEDGLNAVCDAHPVAVVKDPELAWTEIDDAVQLERARKLIWPRIAAREGARSQ